MEGEPLPQCEKCDWYSEYAKENAKKVAMEIELHTLVESWEGGGQDSTPADCARELGIVLDQFENR